MSACCTLRRRSGRTPSSYRLAPSALLVFPDVADREFRCEFKRSTRAHLEMSGDRCSRTRAAEPGGGVPYAVPENSCGLQLVGLTMNSGRSMTASTSRRSVGTPATTCGSGLVVTVSCRGDRVDFDLRADPLGGQRERADVQRYDDREAERGAVVGFGQVDRRGFLTRFGHHQRVRARGPTPRPCARSSTPRGSRSASACAFVHSGTFERNPVRPSGALNCNPSMRCCPSPRCNSSEKFVKPPAWSVVAPAISCGLNGSGPDGHGAATGAARDREACSSGTRPG